MNPDATNEVLRFDVGDLRCAVPLSHVREVQRAVAVTPLPGAPEIVDGVIDVRGEVVPVIDLGRRFGLPRRPLRASQSMVLVWTGERLVALRADRVHWLEELAPDAVVNASRLTRGPLELAGVARTTDGLVLLQDPEALLRQAESETLDAALAARSDG
ncbi:MAG: chemotaxis protein CheW [Candidatus Cloacimonetes bacterium]|nr:chemotaxis protein CheW [Candidatus Cloacimonadota bacterium]